MSLIFRKIENGAIFTRDFNPLIKHNEISFSTEGIAVVYGPNGTGKTSLIKVLGSAKGTKIEYSFDGSEYQSGEGVFHIINDQNNRNIISGETRDFFLGDNIRREYELQDQIVKERESLISSITTMLKSLGISAANSPLLDFITCAELVAFIKDCVNSKSRGSKYNTQSMLSLLRELSAVSIPEFSEEKLSFLKTDYSGKQSIIKQLKQLSGTAISPNAGVNEIEENTEAIGILSRFHKDKCIVCDNEGIDWESLLKQKTAHRKSTLESLDEKVRELIEQIIPLVPETDPFEIKEKLLRAISLGDAEVVTFLCSEFAQYEVVYYSLVINNLASLYSGNEIQAHFDEYQRIVESGTDITDEDYLYIQEIISNGMRKPLSIERDDNKRLRIYLSNQEFLGKPREELPLSTGEQNFLSLTFEFLRAKNSDCPIVVIDDPVSSFDSIYKNKVVYAIVKMLHQKKRIVLTHNTDLIRLLDGQYKHCFKLYLLNNTDGEENGFIALKNNEQDMLISLEKLLSAFRESVPKYVREPELFLISMIPFMRGYASVIHNRELYESLTQVMHGYKNEQVDIGSAYKTLFGEHEQLPDSYEVSVPEILCKTIDGVHLVDSGKYPLLDRTLQHAFTYLFLRLLVEKKLVEKYTIDTNQNEQLGQIISSAYPDKNDISQIRRRIRLTSKKTLINEFNHFEGNLSIFQPAIDITDQALGKERTDIISFINSL